MKIAVEPSTLSFTGKNQEQGFTLRVENDSNASKAYYPYNHPQQSDHQQQYQQYYNPTTTTQDYATAHHHQYHQEPISIHPPGVPLPPQQPQTADPDPTHLQNAYYPHGVAEDQKQQVDSSSGYGGLNPAAVAALSQLSQLTGNIEAAQRTAQPPSSLMNLMCIIYL
ncbi:hypothetical protein ACFX2F_016917 [Malus domestica]